MGYMILLSFTRLMKDKVLAYTYNYIDVLGCDTYMYVCLFSCFDLQYMYAYKGNVTLTFFYFT